MDKLKDILQGLAIAAALTVGVKVLCNAVVIVEMVEMRRDIATLRRQLQAEQVRVCVLTVALSGKERTTSAIVERCANPEARGL